MVCGASWVMETAGAGIESRLGEHTGNFSEASNIS